MPHLYRSAKDLDHWYVYGNSQGWMRFPAKVNGWAERQPAFELSGLGLHEVPLWLSFRTGLLESKRARRVSPAAA